MTTPSVEIIVVKYNQPNFEATTLERVASCTHYENYSLRAYQNVKGRSLSSLWNQLIEESDADYICLLNSDTVVTPGWLTNLMQVFESVEDVAAVVPSSNRVFLSQIAIPFPHETTDFDKINRFAETQQQDGACEKLPTLSGMCVVFPKILWEKVGKFDEDFFLYGEDTEFFYRMGEQTGKHLLWYHAVYVHHYKAQSTIKAIEDGDFDYQEIRERADKLCAEKMPGFPVNHTVAVKE
jgi:cellulose synthase/poly-beta-1,6-N-acetylglucosamine synthase-like glycosyltransferase